MAAGPATSLADLGALASLGVAAFGGPFGAFAGGIAIGMLETTTGANPGTAVIDLATDYNNTLSAGLTNGQVGMFGTSATDIAMGGADPTGGGGIDWANYWNTNPQAFAGSGGSEGGGVG